MKNKNKSAQYRQGDVLIERISRLPPALTKTKTENGKVILAHGEVTGHHHAFSGSTVDKFTGPDGSEYFDVRGQKIRDRLTIMRRWKNQVMVSHPKLGIIEFSIGDVEIIGNEVLIDGEFGLLVHDEHHTHGIPAGAYRGGGAENKVRQREYHPKEIRNVAD